VSIVGAVMRHVLERSGAPAAILRRWHWRLWERLARLSASLAHRLDDGGNLVRLKTLFHERLDEEHLVKTSGRRGTRSWHGRDTGQEAREGGWSAARRRDRKTGQQLWREAGHACGE
jgi:hypothetical protein